MKIQPISKILMAFVAIFSLIACDNEPLEGNFGGGGGPTNPPVESNFQVDIDGETFVADQSSAITFMGNTTVKGTTSNGAEVSLSFSGAGVGTYSLMPSMADGSATYQPADGSDLYFNEFDVDTVGVVTITEYDLQNQVVSGTFEFIASRFVDPEDESLGIETKVFSNGTFSNVPLQSDEEPEPEQGYFQVELDGVLLVGQDISATYNADGLLISATNGVQEIGFQIFDPTVGSFNLMNEEDALVLYDPDNTNDEDFLFHSSEGTITITALDEVAGTVSGDFSGILTEAFGAADDIQMTNGIFDNITFSTTDPVGSATALIDGEAFDATIFPVVHTGGTVQVTFSNDLEEAIRLIFPENVSEGTYPITAVPEAYSGSYTFENTLGEEIITSAIPDSGEITIISVVDEVVTGTFHFQTENMITEEIIEITEGEFVIDISF